MISYKYILKLSIPIMIGSAVQNVITLTDTVFMGRVGMVELGAIGLVGVFYLLITTLGYQFTKAGQIMIARRIGSGHEGEIGEIIQSMAFFAFLLSVLMFFIMKWGGEFFFSLFVRDRDILRACIDYLNYRSYGVFFSYLGVVVLSLYTGISRTTVIIYNALVMGLANVVLNYCLVFGNWGFPEMGIGGSALASTLSEILAFLVFVFYIFNDKKLAPYKIFEFKPIDVNLIKSQIKLSIPMILQTFASLGSWFLFFALIEQIGRNELAISNIMRTVYMLFMIPAWGFSSGINTIVSNLIGKRAYRDVIQAINKTALLCFSITMFLGFLLYLFPSIILRIGTNDEYLIEQSKRLIWVLVSILAFYSVSIIYFNGMVGTGATKVALYIQVFCVFLYIAYVYYVVGIQKASLEWSWMAENVYMISSLIISVLYMRSHSWIKLKI